MWDLIQGVFQRKQSQKFGTKVCRERILRSETFRHQAMVDHLIARARAKGTQQ